MTILRGGVKQVGTIGQRGRVDLPFTVGQRDPMSFCAQELIAIRSSHAPTQFQHAAERGTRPGGLAIDDQHIEIRQCTHASVISPCREESSAAPFRAYLAR